MSAAKLGDTHDAWRATRLAKHAEDSGIREAVAAIAVEFSESEDDGFEQMGNLFRAAKLGIKTTRSEAFAILARHAVAQGVPHVLFGAALRVEHETRTELFAALKGAGYLHDPYLDT